MLNVQLQPYLCQERDIQDQRWLCKFSLTMDDPLPAPLTDRNLGARQQSSTASRLTRHSASAKPSLPTVLSPAPNITSNQKPSKSAASEHVTSLPIGQSHPPEVNGSSDNLSAFACPICFSPPTNATLTPCGHVSCGACLFTAVAIALRTAEDRIPR